MVLRDESQNLLGDGAKARSYGLAGIDQNDDVELGFIRAREAAEIPNDHVSVDYGEVIRIDCVQQTVVLVSGKECDPDLGSAGAVGNLRSVVIRAGKKKTGENDE